MRSGGALTALQAPRQSAPRPRADGRRVECRGRAQGLGGAAAGRGLPRPARSGPLCPVLVHRRGARPARWPRTSALHGPPLHGVCDTPCAPCG
jgi:hypothetical protein